MAARPAAVPPRKRPTALCAHCGQQFELPPLRRGPRPQYCSPAHRQRAYELRRAATATAAHDEIRAERDTTRAELTRLRAKISRLERENIELRRERDDALEEIHRLRPLPAHLARLAGREPEPAPLPPPRRRRRLR